VTVAISNHALGVAVGAGIGGFQDGYIEASEFTP
jgi:hypothetical protein